MIKFPYGIMDFSDIITEGYFYQDRTAFIEKCENTAKTLFCVRPRRMGKTLWLDTLASYYDILKKDRFEDLFGNLHVGKHPTSRRNSYLILRLDFSKIQPGKTVEEIESSFNDYIYRTIKKFSEDYRDFIESDKLDLYKDSCTGSLDSLCNYVESSGHKLYVLIDEYDNFTNELISTNRSKDYSDLVTGDGFLKSFFKVLKAGNIGAIDRTFVTGVTPITLTDLSSAYNIATHITFKEEFNSLLGFTKEEVEAMLEMVLEEIGLITKKKEILSLMKYYYDGYTFSRRAKEHIYNPTLTMYFLNNLLEEKDIPQQLLDRNLDMDINKLEHITKLSSVHNKVFALLENEEKVSISHIVEEFKLKELLTMDEQADNFLWSYLFYHGILTFGGIDRTRVQLKIPNTVSRHFYYDRIRYSILPKKLDISEMQEKFFLDLNLSELQSFLEKTVLPYLSNRDYIQANELSMKIMFLSLMMRDDLYIIDSEKEILRGYCDLFYLGRGDTRKKYGLKDILIEFKFIKLSELEVTQKEIKELSYEELENLPLIQAKLKEAKEQLSIYKERLEKRFLNHNPFFKDMSDFKIHPLSIVFIGFDRVVVKPA
ncbi:MAG: AAA family ATPase [Leptospiraceae bacterium]|nr:AAA family ATPase [Leptospiraceae bacterium]